MSALYALTPYGAGLVQTYLASLETYWLGIGTAITAGALVELTGTGYARSLCAVQASGALLNNTLGMSFGPAPTGGWTIAAAAAFDAATGGHAILQGLFDTPIVVLGGQYLTFDLNTFSFSLAAPS